MFDANESNGYSLRPIKDMDSMKSTHTSFSRLSVNLLVAGILAVWGIRSVSADTNLFVDNFEQFTVGMDLSATNYLPLVGTAVGTSSTGAGTGAVATNLFGSTGAYVTVGQAPDVNTATYYDYTNALSQTYINEKVDISWNAMFVNTNTDFAGMILYLNAAPSGESFFLQFQDGTISKWTDVSTSVPVGTYGEGVLTTNNLHIDYSTGRYSYSLNGSQLIANEPIPSDYMATNFVNTFVIEFYSYDVDSGSLSYFLDNVVVSIPEPSSLALIGTVLAAGLAFRRRR